MSLGLEVSDLVVHRQGQPDRTILGPLDFEVEQGSVIGIVGETGAGKTLTLRALMGLLPDGFSTTAVVRIGKAGPRLTNEVELRAQLGTTVGVVSQNPLTAFDPLKSVESQVVEGVVRRKILSRQAAHDRPRTARGGWFQAAGERHETFPQSAQRWDGPADLDCHGHHA